MPTPHQLPRHATTPLSRTLSRRGALAALGGVPLLWTAAACGTTEPAATPSSSMGGSAASGGDGGTAITVTDGRGTTVTLPAAATKVVALEWSSVENVLSLGVQPVGVADVKGFRSWDTSVDFTTEPTDVGLRGEPSIESIASLEPDLIIGDTTSIPDAALAQMQKIAPIALFQGGDTKDQLALAQSNLDAIATLLGKKAEGTQVWNDFQSHLDQAAAKLSDADATSAPYVFVGVFLSGGAMTVRVHTATSLPGAVADRMGLTNAWKEEGDAAWGLANTDLEGMTTLPDDTRILIWGNDDEGDAVTKELAKNAVWQGLPSVKNGLVSNVANGIWVYGGPASLTRWSDDLTTALTK